MIKRSNDCPLKETRFKDGTLVKGVKYRTLAVGEMTMCTVMEYSQGAVVPPHKHHHEQVGYIVSGKYRATVAGKVEVLGPGDSYAFPGNTEHAFEALESGQIIDVFTPVRKEYLDAQ